VRRKFPSNRVTSKQHRHRPLNLSWFNRAENQAAARASDLTDSASTLTMPSPKSIPVPTIAVSSIFFSIFRSDQPTNCDRAESVFNSRASSGARPSTAHESPAAARGNSATPNLAVPTGHRPPSNASSAVGGAGGFTPVNADPSGGRSARPSPPTAASSRLSPHLSNGNANANPRKRSFSSLDSSPGLVAGYGHHVEYDATRFALHFLQSSPFVRFGLIDPSNLSVAEEQLSSDDMPGLTEDGLPSVDLMQELFTLFFDKWHSMLPCLYKQRIMAEIVPGGSLTHPNTLTFAILALSGYLHPDVRVKAASNEWANLGKQCFDRAVAEGQYDMQVVQGGIYLCLRMFGLAEMSPVWVFLSSVWRICLPLGFHQIDSNSSAYRGFLPDPRSELEIEERRRTAWAVFILDRLVSSVVPWTASVVDSEFCVNFPVSEEVFQSGSMGGVGVPIPASHFGIADHSLERRTHDHRSLSHGDRFLTSTNHGNYCWSSARRLSTSLQACCSPGPNTLSHPFYAPFNHRFRDS
jgi:hypothetical protein